jgi:hypothetical protein
MKYYIVTIAAIFIAIGIGILVGFNLNYDEELSRQQSLIIDDLDIKFEQLKDTNDELKDSLEALNKEFNGSIDYISQNTDRLVWGVLTDRKIGIISTNRSTSYTEEMVNTLSNADASVVFNILIKEVGLDEDEFNEISGYFGQEIKTEEELVNLIGELLNSEYNRDKLNYLSELGIIEINNLEDDYYKLDSIVIVGGNNSEDEELALYNIIDKSLINKFKENDKYIIGTEKTGTKQSYIDFYKENGIATVDNVDEGIGRLSLVLKLQSKEESGSYGRLESADSLIPYKK